MVERGGEAEMQEVHHLHLIRRHQVVVEGPRDRRIRYIVVANSYRSVEETI